MKIMKRARLEALWYPARAEPAIELETASPIEGPGNYEIFSFVIRDVPDPKSVKVKLNEVSKSGVLPFNNVIRVQQGNQESVAFVNRISQTD
jgi:hypothetical protein